MNGYHFTERVHKVLALAREEAGLFGHEYVGTEHILLAILREPKCIAIAAIENQGVTGAALRAAILDTLKPGTAERGAGRDVPYTSRAKRALEFAMSAAREANHNYVGTEHLLLGLLLEENGIAAHVLVEAGIELPRTRDEVLRILGKGRAEAPHDEDVEARYPSPDPYASLHDIIAAAAEIARTRARRQPSEGDLLEALVFSSTEVAAAFASREIEIQGLIDEIRSLTETP